MRYTDDQIRNAVKTSISLAGVLRKLGLVAMGGNYKTIKFHISRLSLNTSHFTGKGYLKGKTHNWSKKIELADILSGEVSYSNSGKLKRRLLKSGHFERKCYSCGITEWLGKPAPLELEHKNGNPTDHRSENLTLLCPNCHSFTTTYRGRGKKRKNKDPNSLIKREEIQNVYCFDCGVKISKRATRCRSCVGKMQTRKVANRPSKQELLEEVGKLGYSAVGRKFGVSDNAIRKWLN